MKIAQIYSHLNGLEYIQVHSPKLWDEIQVIIGDVNASECKTKESKEKTKKGKMLYSAPALNSAMDKRFEDFGWEESRVHYWVTENADLVRKTVQMDAHDQKKAIEKAGAISYRSYNQTDYVKENIAVEVQFGKYPFIAYDLFVKHLAFYLSGKIQVGIEIIPMKALQSEMTSGVGYYEGELYNLIRGGKGNPTVPLVLIGIEDDEGT